MSESPLARPTPAMCPAASVLALVALLATPELALAADADDGAPVRASPAVRRQGFSFGLSGGVAVASASGYRNDVTEIGLPEFEQSTGAGVSGGGAIWVGTSLADWLSVGLGIQSASFEGNGLEARSFGLNIRIETFPLFYRGGPWQDLGAAVLVGTGGINVERARDTVAEGEATSLVGLGTFFEPWRFWQFSTGPEISYTHQFSRSISAHQLIVGWRLAFYRGP